MGKAIGAGKLRGAIRELEIADRGSGIARFRGLDDRTKYSHKLIAVRQK